MRFTSLLQLVQLHIADHSIECTQFFNAATSTICQPEPVTAGDIQPAPAGGATGNAGNHDGTAGATTDPDHSWGEWGVYMFWCSGFLHCSLCTQPFVALARAHTHVVYAVAVYAVIFYLSYQRARLIACYLCACRVQMVNVYICCWTRKRYAAWSLQIYWVTATGEQSYISCHGATDTTLLALVPTCTHFVARWPTTCCPDTQPTVHCMTSSVALVLDRTLSMKCV